MTSPPLSLDDMRCMGMKSQHQSLPPTWCPNRSTCARYQQRIAEDGEHLFYAAWLCGPGGFDRKIACEASK